MAARISEQDEFLLSQLLDGDLSTEQALALQRRLADEPALRSCYEAMCKVDRTLKSRRTLQPDVNLKAFHAELMQHVANDVPVSEQDEYLVGELVDGELSAVEQRAVEQRMQTEPALRQVRNELESLNANLAERRSDQPSVDYAQFHKQVMDRVAAESHPERAPIRFPTWFRVTAPIAVAASILLAVLLQPFATTIQPGPAGVQPMAANTQQPAPEDTQPGSLNVVVAHNTPSRENAGPLNIQITRPNETESASDGIQVSYTRNTELAEAVRDADTEQASRPSRKVFFTAVAASPVASGGEGDLF